jgi:hypothetical protein
MTEEKFSRRRIFALAAAVAAAAPMTSLALSQAYAQSDQAPVADKSAPKKKMKTTKAKTSKMKPAADPAAAATPK